MEFFTSIGKWFIENKDSIVLVLTSSQFIALATAILTLIKSRRSRNDNTASNKVLAEKLEKLTSELEVLNSMQKDLAEIKISIDTINENTAKSEEKLELIVTKLNSQLEAQINVWSTIKDENIRTTINGILTKARYSETSNIVELRNKVEELQQKLVEQTEHIKKDVEDTVKQVKKVTKNNDTVMRV